MEAEVSNGGGVKETLLQEDEHLVGATVGLGQPNDSCPLIICKLSLKIARLGN